MYVDIFLFFPLFDVIITRETLEDDTSFDYQLKAYKFSIIKDLISLEATDMGKPLYEKYGFVKMNDEMELPNE